MIRTLKYGELHIAKKKDYLRTEVIDIVVDCDANIYEIRLTDNGKLVALLCEEE